MKKREICSRKHLRCPNRLGRCINSFSSTMVPVSDTSFLDTDLADCSQLVSCAPHPAVVFLRAAYVHRFHHLRRWQRPQTLRQPGQTTRPLRAGPPKWRIRRQPRLQVSFSGRWLCGNAQRVPPSPQSPTMLGPTTSSPTLRHAPLIVSIMEAVKDTPREQRHNFSPHSTRLSLSPRYRRCARGSSSSRRPT
jgi:hypothetical protein